VNDICDYCLKNCTIGIDATVLDGNNVMCSECKAWFEREWEAAGNG
jgi:hypothetical protein